MYKISEFAALSSVSAKMLRNYDELGLLRPAYVNPINEYRFYTAEQLPRLNRIIVLKELGFTLQQISVLLDMDVLEPEQLRAVLQQQRDTICARMHADQQRLQLIEYQLARLDQPAPAPYYDVLLRPIAAAPVASAQALLYDDAAIDRLLGDVERFVTQQQARAPGPPSVLYHGCAEHAMHVEIAVPLSTVIPDLGWVRASNLPAVGMAACLVHSGPVDTLCLACTALHLWCDANGYTPSGPLRERYLRAGAAGVVIELQLPVSSEGTAP